MPSVNLTPEEIRKIAAGEFYLKQKGQGTAFKDVECDIFVEGYASGYRQGQIEIKMGIEVRPVFNPPFETKRGMTT